MVKIFAFLDLEQISADFEIQHFETASVFKSFKFEFNPILRIDTAMTDEKDERKNKTFT